MWLLQYLTFSMSAEGAACAICLDTSPPPIQSGCACRGDAGLAHIECRLRSAASQQALQGTIVWRQCQTCKQDFTGAMQTGLAEAWRSRVAGQAVESAERLSAEANLAVSLLHQGNGAKAESILRPLHKVRMRVYGAEHPETLITAGNLAESLSLQGKYIETERIHREVLEVQTRVLGAEHRSTLTTATNLASSLSDQGKHVESETIERDVLGVLKRVLGTEHPSTLATAANLASSLARQGKYAEAEVIQREVLGVEKRVYGAEHPGTLTTAANLASSLAHQGKYAEAEPMLQAGLASCQRALGPAHPQTLKTASSLAHVRARIFASNPLTNAPAPTAPPLPTGTRVLVQRLVAKPEHNGKRARVLSFDARTGRYAVSLDDGKALSLKAECVARIG